MKIYYSIIWVLLLNISAVAQTPSTLSYHGIARNALGAPLAGTTIAVRLSIRDAATGGNTLYSETKSVTTNAFGLYTISINDGAGSRTGDFNGINWSAGLRYLQTEIDPANGSAFIDIGTQQMQSVPHALTAKSLDGVSDPQEGEQLLFENGTWSNKPKIKRYHLNGFGFGVGYTYYFVSDTAVITIEKDNPTITVNISKAFGTVSPNGGRDLTLNIGYRKSSGTVTEFNTADAITGLRLNLGNRQIFTLSGTYHTTFKAGETYEIGMIGFAPFNNCQNCWNDNGKSLGYVEVSY